MSYSNKYDVIFQYIWCHILIYMMSYSNIYDVIFQYIWCHIPIYMMSYLFVARTHEACAYTQIFKRQRASDKRQFCRLSLPVRSHPYKKASVCHRDSQIKKLNVILRNHPIFVWISIVVAHKVHLLSLPTKVLNVPTSERFAPGKESNRSDGNSKC